ncbi:MAG: prephenate dehydrogenase/arogenate dehydrogenase family protein [Candidatus Omnitrophica bacterium]|nr:prephenate dehydrogenase/arogenate dehydrogenase family protein [Candidatus Omnitrophota bacterium]
MRMFGKVALVGVGLIGGSLGMAVKKHRLAREVVGVSRRAASIEKARKRKAIDRGSRELDIIRGADLVVFAAPVSVILRRAPEVARYLDERCIVTDVGSTKTEVAAGLRKIFPRYVGSHPMAGSEKRGVANASADLFRGALCLLTPTRSTEAAAARKVELLWRKVGASTARLTPARHDAIVARVSHLPHAAAFALVNAVPERCAKFGAGGLKDTTRIAASDEDIWTDVFLTNKPALLEALAAFERSLLGITRALRKDDRRALRAVLRRAKLRRQRLGAA